MSASEFLEAIGIRNGFLAVLRAALDASACHPRWIYAVAGYVAPAEAWDDLTPRWQEAVDYWKIPRFHLTDLPKWLGHEKAALCEKNFSRLISDSELHAIGAAVFTADWEKPDWGEDRTQRFDTAYEQSLWFALNVLAQHCELEFPGQQVAVLLDADAPEFAINAMFRKVQETRPCLESVGVGSSHKRKELQCADLAAGFLRRSWVDITTNEMSDLPWGVIPRAGKKGRTSVWSLRPGVILGRALRMHQAKQKPTAGE